MKVVVQRVSQAKVKVAGEIVGEIGAGLALLVGVGIEDEQRDIDWMAEKIAGLRIFEDDDGKMNDAVTDVKGEILSVSQFTLYGDVRKGKRPNFMNAARPEQAEQLYEQFNARLRDRGLRVATGCFGAMMEVSIVNAGPVTIIIDSRDKG